MMSSILLRLFFFAFFVFLCGKFTAVINHNNLECLRAVFGEPAVFGIREDHVKVAAGRLDGVAKTGGPAR